MFDSEVRRPVLGGYRNEKLVSSVSPAVCESPARRTREPQMIRTSLSNRVQSDMSGTVSAFSEGKRD